MQVAQNKCIRYCLNLGNRAHIGIKEFKKINWLPTKERFEQCVCVGIFNFFIGVAPTYISEMYFPLEQSQCTRRSLNKLWIPNQRTNRGLKMLSYLGPRLWNVLPNFLKSLKSVNNFKHKLKESFFNSLRGKGKKSLFILLNILTHNRLQRLNGFYSYFLILTFTLLYRPINMGPQ